MPMHPGRSGRRPGRSARRRLSAVALTAVGCAVALGAFCSQGFALGSSRPSALTQSRQQQPLVAREAEATISTETQGRVDYKGIINPKLQALLQSQEYLDMVEIMNQLEMKGALDDFLGKAKDYFDSIDIFKLAEREVEKGGDKAIIKQVRQDWDNIWPKKADDIKTTSFDTFIKFWNRLGNSKLFDVMLGDVLPDMKKAGAYDADAAKLMSMSEVDREDEIARRMLKSDIVMQYAFLQQDEPRVNRYSDQITDFMTDILVLLERKIALQPDEFIPGLSEKIGKGLFWFCFIALYMGLAFVKVVPNPFAMLDEFMEAPDIPGYEAKYENTRDLYKQLMEEDKAKREAAGEDVKAVKLPGFSSYSFTGYS
eukprot:TRINITY_DN91591_c0_g1_i1.p1 TRINITY_DN91591_c0_g1~~TRINITY_DN91591_c0_g1_i1.p1  ORF type:complete len:390 (-),score=115.10 TRINITY_DN91591_c0_g1_i1:132-1238(-)